jgi:PEP-CTERM motif
MKPIILSTALMLASVCSAQPNVLVNPGFESAFGNPAGPDDGWYQVSESIFRDCSEAHSGTCSATLARDPLDRTRDVLWQDFDTDPGARYTLGFEYKTSRATVLGPGGFVEGVFGIDVDSAVSGHRYPAENRFAGSAAWQTYEHAFTAVQPVTRIAFAGLGFADGRRGHFINVDDVVVMRAVPEPSTWVLWMAGLGMAGLLSRFRALHAGRAA